MRHFDGVLDSLLPCLWSRGLVDPSNDVVLLPRRECFEELQHALGSQRALEIIRNRHHLRLSQNLKANLNRIAGLRSRLFTNVCVEAQAMPSAACGRQACSKLHQVIDGRCDGNRSAFSNGCTDSFRNFDREISATRELLEPRDKAMLPGLYGFIQNFPVGTIDEIASGRLLCRCAGSRLTTQKNHGLQVSHSMHDDGQEQISAQQI